MMYPSIDSLTTKYDSKYIIAVAAAKRARQLVEGAKELVEVNTKKPVSIALFELDAGKILIERVKPGAKQ
ncbi:DNA-directed RNA polymerase subunit omega [Tepidanaerobacter acetatoxydans Re1]|uniref:DNA-directed RNA polymerase subunit omega n=1 Tax=Tepidanaerobacter acetatoxydans (strain DSM 21804 / JCM 16047 / Re1) TaxID=1209989 RepID=F4LVN1_TEPAE|nr:DNA-directed RNA polymerase subunit omega [Tepidanaerobacter acetatoxydans]AEE91617.1 DNA-directed RNA polymerase subunit omega [Tepidanaerobacter acetatoxydans Re1]CCP26355.1 DNA-directed RNA polymerase subunit omega [Tepidanaerobacter acetatoxydans Re1]